MRVFQPKSVHGDSKLWSFWQMTRFQPTLPAMTLNYNLIETFANSKITINYDIALGAYDIHVSCAATAFRAFCNSWWLQTKKISTASGTHIYKSKIDTTQSRPSMLLHYIAAYQSAKTITYYLQQVPTSISEKRFETNPFCGMCLTTYSQTTTHSCVSPRRL